MKAKTQTFSRMSKAAKRVAIAKDAIKQIEAGRLVPYEGSYFYVSKGQYPKRKTQLDHVLPKLTCEVCAIGAMFAGAVNKANNYSVSNGDYIGGGDCKTRLSEFFDAKQLRDIECSFEGFSDMYGGTRKGMKYYAAYPDRAIRLLAILRNIIRNKGTFIPTERDFVRAKGK